MPQHRKKRGMVREGDTAWVVNDPKEQVATSVDMRGFVEALNRGNFERVRQILQTHAGRTFTVRTEDGECQGSLVADKGGNVTLLDCSGSKVIIDPVDVRHVRMHAPPHFSASAAVVA